MTHRMKIIQEKIGLDELHQMAEQSFGNFVKGVVDVQQEILAVDAEMHSDLEALLVEQGSKQEYLWGINLYPELTGDDFIEFDSMINLRPAVGNRSRGVENEGTRMHIREVVTKLITD